MTYKLNTLTEFLEWYCAKHRLPFQSADELLADTTEKLYARRHWLRNFCEFWDKCANDRRVLDIDDWRKTREFALNDDGYPVLRYRCGEIVICQSDYAKYHYCVVISNEEKAFDNLQDAEVWLYREFSYGEMIYASNDGFTFAVGDLAITLFKYKDAIIYRIKDTIDGDIVCHNPEAWQDAQSVAHEITSKILAYENGCQAGDLFFTFDSVKIYTSVLENVSDFMK